MPRPPITFFIHPKFWPRGPMPQSPDEAWSGYNLGLYSWIIQTVLRLRQAGLDIALADSLPDEGIVIAHGEYMEMDGFVLRPGPKRLVVSIAADLDLRPGANLQLVQNPRQARRYPNCYPILFWPEPGLVPRAADAGDRFQNIAYLGNEKNLAPELQTPEWAASLTAHGFRWIPMTGEEFQYDDPSKYRLGGVWTDYREIDAVVAVRRFLPADALAAFDHKPPSKLINAWIAGVPAVLGHESAFRALRRSDLDFIEVHSAEETLAALCRLRDDPPLRTAMRDNGRSRVPEVDADATVRMWITFLQDVAIPAYERWVAMGPWRQHSADWGRKVSYHWARLCKKLGIRS